MDLKKLQFIITDKEKLTTEEKNYLLHIYIQLFNDIYGNDIVEVILNKIEKITKDKNKYFNFKNNSNKTVASLIENDYELILIYNECNKLIGAGRIKIFNDGTASIPDIAIGEGLEEEKREIWRLTVKFIENYLKEKELKKVYVEIPLTNPYLLFRADELGFKEDPEDIVINETTRTYLLNKKLERKKDE